MVSTGETIVISSHGALGPFLGRCHIRSLSLPATDSRTSDRRTSDTHPRAWHDGRIRTADPSPERAALLERETLLLVGARRDPEQFGELFKLLWPELVDRLARQTMCPEVAADLASETFAKVVIKADRFDPNQAPARAWVWGIAQNQLRGWVRHGQVDGRARRKIGFHVVPDPDVIDELLTQTIAADLRSHLTAALAQLSPPLRQVVEMKIVEHRSYSDIARLLGCSEQTARTRFARAITKLRTAMADQAGVEAWL